MNNEQNWTDFKQLWATAFPPLTERDGVKYWEKFVLSSNWNTLEQTFDIISGQYRTKKAAGVYTHTPKLADFKDLYWSITNRSHVASTPASDCSGCENTGYVVVVRQEFEPGAWRICDKETPFPADTNTTMGVFAVPCWCRHAPRRMSEIDAMTIRDNNFGAPGASRHEAQSYIDECRRLWHEQENNHG